MTMQNPVALAANTLRQIGESANQTVMSIGTQFAQVNSQLLRGLATGAPPFPLGLPPIPGLATLVNGGNPGHNGNGIPGPLGLLPTPQQFIPRPAIQAIAQLENALLPAGLPRPAQVLLQALGNGAPEREAPPVETGISPTLRAGSQVGLEGLNGVQQGARRDVGIQLV